MTDQKGGTRLPERLGAVLGSTAFRGRHLVVFDAIVTVVSLVLSLALRFDAPSSLFDLYLAAFAPFIPLLVVARLVVFVALRLYQRVWRYASVDELLAVVFGSVLSSAIAYGALWLGPLVGLNWAVGFPRSIPVIDTLLIIALAGAWRFSFRLAGARRRGASSAGAERALVVGGGAAALSIIRDLRSDPQAPFDVIGVLADDLEPHQRLMGVPVLGGTPGLGVSISRHRIDVVLLALPSTPGKEIRHFVHQAERLGARCLTVPSVAEIASGRATFTNLREIDVEDLLRRSPARIDATLVAASFEGSRILVTGAGGSIGGELARQLIAFHPKRLILLGHGENSIFDTMQSLDSPSSWTDTRITPVIMDIRDGRQLARVIDESKPDVVFHAAAHKHVGSMERYPEEAATTNVFGTQKLLQACLEEQVPRFVLISTDKAVNPTSVMGASKRVAELLVQRAAAQSGLRYACVRFGNVLSSRGSVVPTFRRQLAKGGPLLVTDPDVSRYFMTIPEAVQLVLQAAAFARPADTLILDMGEPVRIADLAKDLIELHGLEAGRDIDIEFTGLRPGEKLREELLFPDEVLDRTEHDAILRVRQPLPLPLLLDAGLTELHAAVEELDRVAIVRALSELVPQFTPSSAHLPR